MAAAMARVNRTSARRQQRGVAAIFAAVALVTLVSAVTLAIDIGRLYTTQRNLQRLADLAAIDGAKMRSQCLGVADFDAVLAEVAASLARNRLPTDVTQQVQLGKRLINVEGVQYFQATPAGVAADSVQVTLKRPSPARILPLFAGDQTSVLTAKAAALGSASASVPPPQATLPDASADFANRLYGGQINSNLGLSGNQFRASFEATVDGTTLADPDVALGLPPLPPVDVPQPVQGLLNQLLAALDAAGDQAAASAVAAFRDGIAAGRGAVTVLPSEVLGLSPGQTYDDVTIPVGNLLANIAAAVSGGEPITIPIPLPPPLGDGVEITVQPGRPGTPDTFTPGVELATSESSDATSASAAFLRVQVQLLNPVTGQPFKLPLYSRIDPARARAVSLSCARLGQQDHQVEVEAQGLVATFAIGQIDQAFSGAGLGDIPSLLGLPPQELFSFGVLGQDVTITSQLDPVTIGDARPQSFCFAGPPFNRAEECDGRAATVGGYSSRDAADALETALQGIRLEVRLPAALPAALAGPVQAQADAVLAQLNAQLAPVLGLLAQQLVPMLQAVNLTAGASEVRVSGLKVVQPKVYAQ